MFSSRRNPHVLRLATAQALAGANSTDVYTTGAIIGNMLAPNPALATLPRGQHRLPDRDQDLLIRRTS
ncbi:hypothetical protein ACUXPM_004834 [Ralstonia sp. 151470066-2]|jgi:hypothetical protein|uniref:hypothetical protein n=1 Tax=Actinomadura sp. 3N407 TaxID=3457423 RepID=UPI000664BC26|nr:hypothetical protein AC240_10960 [Ralstonia sp. MD27]